LNLDDLAQECHQIAVDHGWWEDWNRNVLEQVALMHSELSEAVEEIRAKEDPRVVYFSIGGKPEGFGVELADTIIRILDTCARYKIPIGALVEQKMEYNRSRPYKHGNKTA
jgi:NTP pyrophosphatase (non-canonical NTP hydrolase)